MTPDDFLAVRGVTVEWLEDIAEDVLATSNCSDLDCCLDANEFAWSATTLLSIASEMIEAGVPLPTRLRSIIRAVLRDVSDGVDGRERVGTKRGAGNPGDSAVDDRHKQAAACLELLRLAGVPKTEAVTLVAVAVPMSERNVYDLSEIQANSDWDAKGYLMEAANGQSDGVLQRLIRHRPTDDQDLLTYWYQLREFLSVTDIK